MLVKSLVLRDLPRHFGGGEEEQKQFLLFHTRQDLLCNGKDILPSDPSLYCTSLRGQREGGAKKHFPGLSASAV